MILSGRIMFIDLKELFFGYYFLNINCVLCLSRWEWMCIRWSRVWHQCSLWQHYWLLFLPMLPRLQWRWTHLFWWVKIVCFPHVTVSDTCVSTCLCQQILSTQHSTDSSPLGLSLFTDIDECAVNNGHCEHNCTNESGAYSCQCASGYQLDQDGHGCTGKSHLRRKVAIPFTATEELILNTFTQLWQII